MIHKSDLDICWTIVKSTQIPKQNKQTTYTSIMFWCLNIKPNGLTTSNTLERQH